MNTTDSWGPAGDIGYDKAAIFLSSYYYLMYRDDQQRMWQKNIIPTLANITRTFGETLNYFSIITEKNRKSKTCLREVRFENGDIALDRVKTTHFENLYWEEAISNDDTQQNAMPDSSTASS